MYWLCITNERNWESIKRRKVWGVMTKREISKVKKGDKLVIYLKQEKISDETKEPRIVAIYEVVSDAFEDSSKVFDRDYPYRVKLKPIKILDEPLKFKTLIPQLSFIKNKRAWGAYLQKPMVELPEKDLELIMEKVMRE